MEKELGRKVLRMYNDDGTYMEKNGTDVAITITLIIVFGLVTGFINVKSHMKMLRKDFQNIRCDPTIVPFAGEIAAPEGVDKMKFAADNFEQCTRNILKGIAIEAFNPVEMMMSVFNSTFTNMNGSMGGMMEFFDNLRKNIARIPTLLYGIILSVLVPLKRAIQSMEDLFGRMMAVGQNIINLVTGTTNLLLSVLNLLLNFFIGILIVAVGVIIGLLAAAYFFPPMAAAAGAMILAATALLGFTLAVIIIITTAFGSYADGSEVPSIPSCFHPDTLVETAAGTHISIKDIQLGTELKGGGRVRSKMKIANTNDMYVFKDTNTIVSGTHLVLDVTDGTFIPVSEAFAKGCAILVPYNQTVPEVHCLITSNHIIPAGGRIFHDWEDNNGSASKDW